MRGAFVAAAVAAAGLGLSACSTVMEAARPAPVQLARYHIGEPRADVIAALGAPKSSMQDGADSCDVYSLYTGGPNGAQKAAVILGEAGADFATLGLFEIAGTPAQALTRAKRHTVLMCYGGDGGLASVRDEGKVVVGPGAAPPRGPAKTGAS